MFDNDKILKMNFQNIILPFGGHLFYVYQDRFSVHDFGAVHRYPYRLDHITPMAMMRRMINNVNANYPTVEQMQSFKQQQYGLSWQTNSSLENNALLSTFAATNIRGNLLNQPSVDDALITHVLDSLYQPWFNDPRFMQEDKGFEEEKTFNLYRLQQIQANISEKIFNVLKTMFPSDSAYISDLRGDYPSISALTKADLQPFYHQWIQYPMDFYYVGPKSIDWVSEKINNYQGIKFPSKDLTLTPSPMKHTSYEEKIVQGTQSQSHLVQIYSTEIVRLTRDAYAIRLLNSILGSGQESILFQELREKRQFCYAVSSDYSVNDGSIGIRVGLHKNNLQEAKVVIATQLELIRQGKLEKSLFEINKQQMIDRLIRSKDSVDNKLTVLINSMMLNIAYDEDRALNFYQTLTFEDMQRVAQMIQPHKTLVYLGKES
jgi:predicted Zn-dependent peptidase